MRAFLFRYERAEDRTHRAVLPGSDLVFAVIRPPDTEMRVWRITGLWADSIEGPTLAEAKGKLDAWAVRWLETSWYLMRNCEEVRP